MNQIYQTLIAIAIVVGAFFLGRSTTPIPDAEVRIEVDTIRIEAPAPDTIRLVETVTRWLPSEVDTVTMVVVDSVKVYVPIRQYTFEETGLYKAEVTGYEVSLLSMEVYPTTVYETKTTTVTKQQFFSHGVQFGVGALYGTKGLDFGFYAGYGVQFHF